LLDFDLYTHDKKFWIRSFILQKLYIYLVPVNITLCVQIGLQLSRDMFHCFILLLTLKAFVSSTMNVVFANGSVCLLTISNAMGVTSTPIMVYYTPGIYYATAMPTIRLRLHQCVLTTRTSMAYYHFVYYWHRGASLVWHISLP